MPCLLSPVLLFSCSPALSCVQSLLHAAYGIPTPSCAADSSAFSSRRSKGAGGAFVKRITPHPPKACGCELQTMSCSVPPSCEAVKRMAAKKSGHLLRSVRATQVRSAAFMLPVASAGGATRHRRPYWVACFAYLASLVLARRAREELPGRPLLPTGGAMLLRRVPLLACPAVPRGNSTVYWIEFHRQAMGHRQQSGSIGQATVSRP